MNEPPNGQTPQDEAADARAFDSFLRRHFPQIAPAAEPEALPEELGTSETDDERIDAFVRAHFTQPRN